MTGVALVVEALAGVTHPLSGPVETDARMRPVAGTPAAAIGAR